MSRADGEEDVRPARSPGVENLGSACPVFQNCLRPEAITVGQQGLDRFSLARQKALVVGGRLDFLEISATPGIHDPIDRGLYLGELFERSTKARRLVAWVGVVQHC